MLDRLNNLQSEEELNQINTELEPLEQEAKEYERKKEQEEIDNYIKGLISKYNSLIQNASLEELQELTTKLAKICELISKGKSLNKDLKYYQSIETILDEEKTKEEQKQVEKNKISASTSGIYILRARVDERFRWRSRGHFYLFHQDINKIEAIRDNSNMFDRVTKPDFIDITLEELQKNFMPIEEFFINSIRIELEDAVIRLAGRQAIDVPIYYYLENLGLRYWLNEKGQLTNVKLKTLRDIEMINAKEIEKGSPEEIQRIIDMIKKYLEGNSLRKKQQDETKKDSYLDGINPKLYNEIFGVEFNYGNDTSTKPKGGRTRGGNNDLNY